jgi:hypothetical protein
VKKGLLVGLAIVLGIVAIPFIILKLAFGPIHDSVTIDLGKEGKLVCDETYNADLAGVFYDVKMILNTLDGKSHRFGDVTFHEEGWSKHIVTKRVGDWLVIPFDPENFVQIKMLNTVSGQLNDTTLQPFDLRKDLLYRQKFKDKPDHLFRGSSNIQDISGNLIEVRYEYKAKAEYPSEILVSQTLVYQIDPATGKLQTKEIHERVIQ